MDVSVLSLVDLIRNVSLAVFAVSTWYISHEEKRTRTLVNLIISFGDGLTRSLIEAVIELRDSKMVAQKMGNQIQRQDLERLQRKIHILRWTDRIKDASIVVFTMSVSIEIVMFAYYFLLPLLG